MAAICRICRVRRGHPHKFSCNYSKYRQEVQWVDNTTGSFVGADYDYGDTSSSCDTSSAYSYDSGSSYDSSSSSCDSGGF